MKKNILSINTIMKKYMKYICAVLLLIGTNAYAWGAVEITEGGTILANNITVYSQGGSGSGSNSVVSFSASACYKNQIGSTSNYYISLTTANTFTISTSSGYLEKIVFSPYQDGGGTAGRISVNTGVWDGNNVWDATSNVQSVTFTTTNQVAFRSFSFTVTHSSSSTAITWNGGNNAIAIAAELGEYPDVDITFAGTTGYSVTSCRLTGQWGSNTVEDNYYTNYSLTPLNIAATAKEVGVFNGTLELELHISNPYSRYIIEIPVTFTVTGCADIREKEVDVDEVPTPTYNCSTGYWGTTISWDAVSGANRYNVRLMKWNGSAFAYCEDWHNVGTSLSYTYTTLETGDEYRVKVVGVNTDCPTISSTNDNHTLMGSGEGVSEDFEITCPSVTGIGVVDDAITGNSASLMWYESGNAGCDMVYEVQVKKHSDASVVWSQSPASANDSHALTGLESNTTYDVYVTATNDCGNTANNSAAPYQFTTSKGYTDNKWTCIDLRLVQTDGNTSDPLLITGGYGLGTSSVEATRTLTLTIGGVAANSKVTLSGTNLRFFKNNVDHTEIGANNLTCDVSGNLSAVIKVEYAPTAYTDDNIATPTITVSCDGNEREFAGLVKARCLPEKFVIAAKVNGRWCALPADLATSSGATLQDAYPISVDKESAPRVATVVPKAAVYGFSARNAVTSHTGGIRLDTKTGSSDGHLQAPRSNTNTYLWRASTNCSTGMQDWYLTSKGTSDANFYTYYIGVDPAIKVSSGSGDGEGEGDSATPLSRYLCVYGSKIMWSNTSDKEFRILPIEEETEPVDMQIVEWKANGLKFMYFGNPAYKATAEIEGVSKSSDVVLSSAQVDKGVYEISVNDLQASAYKQLYIIIKNGDTEIGRKAVTIPVIVSASDATTATAASGLTKTTQCPNADVVVLNGGKLTATGATAGEGYTFKSVTVYGGGKLIVPAGIYLTTKQMYLRAGQVSGGAYQYVYPQVYIGSGATLSINDNTINFDYLTNYNQYFAIAFPHVAAINNTNITYPEDIYGATYAKGGSYILRVFDGKIRAAQGAVDAVWADVEEGNTGAGGSVSVQTNTVRGLGYYALFPPRKVNINGGSAVRQDYGIQRVKMNITDAATLTSNETSNTEVAVTAYPAEQVYNSGWWLLGNPYMADLGGAGVTDDGTRKEITMGYIGTNAQGQHEWKDKNVRYVTVPNDDASDTYDQRLVSDYNFPAFKTFYVQVGNTGSVKFGTASRSAAAPKRYNAVGMPSEIETSIALNSENYGDTTHILIGDDFTDEYEIGDDMTKMPNTNVSLYTITGGYELFANALNMQSAMAGIPVGYVAPEEGAYTFSVNDKKNSTWIGNIWLTDFERNERVNLMEGSYEFETLAGTNKTRFVLNIELRSPNDTPTDIGDVEEEEKQGPQKFIRQDKLYIQYNGALYDGTGKKVREINK